MLFDRFHFNGLKNNSALVQFSKVKLADQQGIIWVPFKNKTLMGQVVEAVKLIHTSKPSPILGRGNLDHLKRIEIFWKKYGLKKYQSTGFYFVNCAIVLCEEVHLFGFWPFNTAIDGRSVTVHYYDKTELSPKHDTPCEWKILLSMHHHGLLKLHIIDCSTK